MRNTDLRKVAAFFSFLIPAILFGQVANTPYSMYGIGKIYSNSNNLTMAMGSSTAAIKSPLFVNPYNPASYSAFDSTSFVFDAALHAKLQTLKTSTDLMSSKDAGLAYITMGFPVTRWWKTSLGILPYSSVNYQIAFDSVTENIGKTQHGYYGNGGLNKAYWGNSFEPFRNFSVGFNFAYIFGTLNHNRTITFPDSSNHWSTRMTKATVVRSIYLDFGIQHQANLRNGLTLTSGITFSPGQALTATSDYIAVSYFHNYSTNLDVEKDTSVYEPGVDGEIRMPFAAGGGLALSKGNRWTATADIMYQQWSGFKYFGAQEPFRNSLRISMGGQFRPSPIDVGTYWKRINYRMGMRFEQGFLELRDTRLNDFGISIGVGLPMKKTRSMINLALEAGTFGTTEKSLIKENYFRFSVGASFFEKWFLKRRYD